MSSLYSRRKRSSSFGSYGAYQNQNRTIEKPAEAKPELIEGYAHICFDDEALWFRGILLTADGQSYNLSGERIFIVEENNGGVTAADFASASPDVIRDFPSPMRTPSKGSFELRSDGSSTPSRKNSVDSQSERELQFIMEESTSPVNNKSLESSPPVDASPKMSRSPPSTQQILSALDSLIITSSSTGKMSSISEQAHEDGDHHDKQSPVSPVSPLSPVSPFRSRSGSRSRQNMETISVSYNVVVSDLEEGTQHTIRHVSGRKGSTLALRNRQLCFVTEKAYWGQRATMVIQKQLAVPELLGQKCHVYAGPMRFYVMPRPIDCQARSLTNWCW